MAWEVLLSSVADVIIKQLGEAIENEVALLSGVEDELQKLKDTVSTIKCVLADAEKKQVQEEQIKTWLRRLEGVVYEADDFVDEFSTDQTLRSQQEAMTGNTLAKKVRTFCCSTSFPLGFRHKMGRKIKDIRNKLDAIANDRKFHLVTGLQETEVVTAEWKDHSFQREEDTIGREDDKVEIKKRLFDMKTKENIGVIPIVGVGGLGKTTLAQLVFNDEEVQRHFEPKLWVSVPKVFDLELVVKEVFQSARQGERSTDITLDQMQKDIREKIKGKQFLLVLDDIWDLDNREKWLSLENLLRDGSSGSRIIVTTRDKEVARIINGPEEPPYILKALDEIKAWSLFEKLAFVQEPKGSIIVEIGKEIMKKCGGIPLVIRTIASLLYSRHVDEWLSFKEKELSTISQYDKDVIPRLKLSYDHLPSHLKRCFAYCSLFPKNHIIDVKKLINLWMAQGFIKLSNHQERPEDMGYQHFTDLLYRSFFEKVGTDDILNIITKCKMHDCMHDLAMSVAGPQCVMLNLNVAAADDDKIETTTHHMSFNFGLRDHQSFADFWVRAKRIRTILFNKCSYSSMLRLGNSLDKIDLQFKFLRTLGLSGLGMETVRDSIGRLKHLRCLDLSANSMKALPDSIGNLHNLQTLDLSGCESLEALPDSIGGLKHLRYLDLSRNSMKVWPDSIVNLHNLQTLDLQFCGTLEALPVDIWKLVNLRHLYTDFAFRQIHLPRGLSQLTNLQTLTEFQVKAEHGSQLNELRDLNNLRGRLRIAVQEDGIKSEGANLKSKQHLQYLQLWIDGKMVDDCGDLVPHSNIKSFTLLGPYPGAALLNCVPSLKNLVEFTLWGHKECQSIAALNHLPHLKVLHLRNLKAVEYISSDDYDDNVVDGNLLPFFPSLQRLGLFDIPNLKGWWKGVENTENTSRSLPFFPCLSQLVIDGCPNLICMPLFPYLQELHLRGTRIKPFQQTLMMKNIVGPPTSSDKASSSSSASSAALLPLSTLKILTIDDIDDIHELQYFPDGFITLTSLKKLSIVNCSKLKYLFPGLHHLISLQQLDIHDCKELEMPNEDSDAILWRHLQSLSILSLYKLPKLVALPEGLQQVTSLQEIIIFNCEILEAVLECVKSLKSLRRLVIKDCPSLMCLPEGIDGLTSLKNLEIVRCPILLEKCLEDTGEYWPMISHIKNRRLVDF